MNVRVSIHDVVMVISYPLSNELKISSIFSAQDDCMFITLIVAPAFCLLFTLERLLQGWYSSLANMRTEIAKGYYKLRFSYQYISFLVCIASIRTSHTTNNYTNSTCCIQEPIPCPNPSLLVFCYPPFASPDAICEQLTPSSLIVLFLVVSTSHYLALLS